ncbi:MAG: pyridoxine 5'-phosphate oxidase C-terminal domain-containing protein [Flavobacteriales bacterium]|nr:pyridoxine 5'-phosphate oxidase C-terminal domain-containing protein [Flavobacteriales bacterium]
MNWGGYKVMPKSVEFWQGRPSRLHDRVKYTISKNNWKLDRLAP